MQKDLASDIRQTAAHVRKRDFLWVLGIGTGVVLGAALSQAAPIWLLVAALGAFYAALAIRYRVSSGRVWAEPIQRIVETEFNAQEAELSTLRMARNVAESLPEPLFILDAEDMVELINPAAATITGGAAGEGRHIATVLRAPTVIEAVEQVRLEGEPKTVDFVTSGAVERSCRAFVAPLTDVTGGPARILVFIRDLTTERRLEQMRADFIASASHELRTPLASVIGFIETLQGPAKKDEEAQGKFLKIMHSQAERMQRLVSDLMSLSRIELNEHVPPSERIDLVEIANDVYESLAPLFERKNAIVDFVDGAKEPLSIIGDRDEIFQTIQNLLDNAVKYGGSPPMVKIRVGKGVAPILDEDGEIGPRAGDTAAQVAARLGLEVNELAYVQIRDFGAGVERSDLPRLTERFYRVNVERSLKSGGTGLGLAIVKHIINRHKGGFHIESQLARGSAFTCYFGCAPFLEAEAAEYVDTFV